MNISVSKISTSFKGDYCFTHARAAFRPDGFGILTTQPLRLSGSDIFFFSTSSPSLMILTVAPGQM